MARRILAAFVHVVDEDGQPVVLAPGRKLPKWAASQVTNPDAFTDVDDTDEAGDEGAPTPPAPPATPAEPVTPPVTPAVTEPVTPAELTEPAEPVAPAAPAESAEQEPQSDLAYADRSYRSLQAAAKLRDLDASGKAETLIARLEADDRDRAAQ